MILWESVSRKLCGIFNAAALNLCAVAAFVWKEFVVLPSLQRILLALFVIGFSAASLAHAEEKPRVEEPRIKGLLASPQAVLDDLEFLVVGLAREKKQWVNNIQPSIEIFLLGVDYNKPLRWDILVNNDGPDEKSGYRFQPSIPIDRGGKGLRTFIKKNLVPIGIEPRLKKRGYYQLTGDVFEGWMRVVGKKKKKDYACIAAKGHAGDVPANMPYPGDSHKELLALGYDVALDLVNTADQTELRKSQADDLLNFFMKKVQRKPDETQAKFDFRKLSQQHTYEQMHRVYVESEHFTVGWVTNESDHQGEAEFELHGLPDTGLRKYLESMGTEPSRFAALEMPEDPVMGLRLNLPFDDFRRAQLDAWYPVARAAAQGGIDTSERFTESEKGPAKQATDLLFDMLSAGDPLGRLDLFADITVADADKHAMVVGVVVADGKAADEIVKLLPQVREGWNVEMETETVGDTAIHKIDASARLPKAMLRFFGESGLAYVATSPTTVWIAGGDGSLELLKASIVKVGDGADRGDGGDAGEGEADKGEAGANEADEEDSPDEQTETVEEGVEIAAAADVVASGKFVDLKLQAGPIVSFANDLGEETGLRLADSINIKPPGGAAGTSGQGRPSMQPIDPADIREIIRRALVGIDDRVTGVISRTDDHISGRMTFAPGILRSFGKIIAKVAKDNL